MHTADNTIPGTQAAAAWSLPTADQPLPLPLTGFGLQDAAEDLGWPRDDTGGGWDGDLSLLLPPVSDTSWPEPTISNPALANPDAFRSLSACLSERSWTTTEQGMALVDREWARYIDALLDGCHRDGPPFVHWRDWEPSRRSEPLAGAAVVAQLTAAPRTPQLAGVLVDVLEAQLARISLKVSFSPPFFSFPSPDMSRRDRLEKVPTPTTSLRCTRWCSTARCASIAPDRYHPPYWTGRP